MSEMISDTAAAPGISKATREAVVDKLTGNLKSLYPLAQRADEELDILRKQNKGKFAAIFQKDSPFSAQSDRFLPYMVEAAGELSTLLTADDAVYMKNLKSLMQKVHLLSSVLVRFHALADEEQPQQPQSVGSPTLN